MERAGKLQHGRAGREANGAGVKESTCSTVGARSAWVKAKLKSREATQDVGPSHALFNLRFSNRRLALNKFQRKLGNEGTFVMFNRQGT